MGSRKRRIVLINTGVISVKNRGKKVTDIEADLLDHRERAILPFQDQTVRAKTMKDCMPVDQYEAEGMGDPRTNGEVIELIYHMNEWQECVVWNVQRGKMF